MQTDLIFFPYYHNQPYYKCLYNTFDSDFFNIKPGNVDQAIDTLYAKGCCLLHLHHLDHFFTGCQTDAEAWRECSLTINKLGAFRRAGGKLVWTVHNKLGHDGNFVSQERRLAHYIGSQADLVHIHSSKHLQLLAEIIPINSKRIVVSRHGNWIDVYGEFDINERVKNIANRKALFVGQLRAYKSLENLLRIIYALDKSGYETMIAGRPANHTVEQYIKIFAPKNTRLFLKYLSAFEMHSLCVEYNTGILSYDSILTSGTLMLYLSYGMNIISTPLEPGEGGHAYANAKIYASGSVSGLLGATVEELGSGAMQNYLLAKNESWDGALATAARALVVDNHHVEISTQNRSQPEKTRKICARPFYHFEITPSGDVYPCCPAMCKHYKLGNMHTMPLEEIWFGKKAERFRKLIGRQDYSECDLGLCTHYDGRTREEIRNDYYDDAGKCCSPHLKRTSFYPGGKGYV